MAEIRTGTIIKDRYILKERKGSGSFGEVWQAHDRMIGKDVALKIYLTLDPAGVEEFKREYADTLDLSSPYLLTPHYFDVWERRPFLVMKYCERGSAAKLAGHIAENELWKFVHDVAAGLDVLHSQREPMVHQDIKPDNILVDGDGRFLITDFGISKRLRATMRKQSGHDMTSGAIPYMAPERFESSPMLSTASDVWSLGASIYELATGELPFSGFGGGMQLSGAKMPSLGNGWSVDLNKLMQSCLARNVSDRPTAKQVADLSDGILKGKPVRHVGEATSKGWTYQGELLDGKPHGKGIMHFDNGNTYEGDFVNGLFNGQGKYVYAHGDYYVGNWKDNKRNGQGKVYADGSYYVGNWKDNKRNGQGKYVYADGSYYEGNFKDDKRTGQGKYVYADGSYYEGNWKDDKYCKKKHTATISVIVILAIIGGYLWWNNRDKYEENGNITGEGWTYQGELLNGEPHGKGTKRFDNGGTYEGDFVNGKFNGQGKLVWADGSYYEGNFKDDKFNGQGKEVWADGGYYEGNWKDGNFNGQGKRVWADGDYYVGNWKDDKKDGQGKYVWTDGDYYVGNWKDDKKDGQGKYVWTDGSYYEGNWKDGKRDGQGKEVWANGGYYEGNWKDGNFNGQGKRVWANGDYYVGNWKDDKKDGYGKHLYTDGYYYEGNWKDGKRNGYGKLIDPNGRCCFEGNWKDDQQDG